MPGNVAVVASPTRPTALTLSWAVPGSNGGEKLSGYTVTVTASNSETPRVLRATGTSLRFTATPGVTYSFAVEARNVVGSSSRSAPVSHTA
jgi:hypothetical protein